MLKSLTPGQMVVKVVHDELTELLGEDTAELELGQFSVILLAGLQGSGKTTAAAKLALQLEGQRAQARRSSPPTSRARPRSTSSSSSARRSTSPSTAPTRPTRSRRRGRGSSGRSADRLDTVIVDTAGRLQIDEALMDELVRVRDAVEADERAARARRDDRPAGRRRRDRRSRSGSTSTA